MVRCIDSKLHPPSHLFPFSPFPSLSLTFLPSRLDLFFRFFKQDPESSFLELCDGFSTKMKLLCTNSSYQRKKMWMGIRWCFSWFPWSVCPFLASLFLCGRCSESEDSFSILSSPQDKLHCQLSITVCTCTPLPMSKLHQQNRFFVGS